MPGGAGGGGAAASAVTAGAALAVPVTAAPSSRRRRVPPPPGLFLASPSEGVDTAKPQASKMADPASSKYDRCPPSRAMCPTGVMSSTSEPMRAKPFTGWKSVAPVGDVSVTLLSCWKTCGAGGCRRAWLRDRRLLAGSAERRGLVGSARGDGVRAAARRVREVRR